MKQERITNLQFARQNKEFIAACRQVYTGVDMDGNMTTLPPTARQASKYRNKKGAAYKFGR